MPAGRERAQGRNPPVSTDAGLGTLWHDPLTHSGSHRDSTGDGGVLLPSLAWMQALELEGVAGLEWEHCGDALAAPGTAIPMGTRDE